MRTFLIAALIFYILNFLSTLIYHLKEVRTVETLSRAFIVLGVLSHAAALILRINSTGHAPMASMFETLVFYSWTTALVTVLVVFRYREMTAGLITVPVAMLALFFALLNQSPPESLVLVLRTHWFEAHVTLSFAAYALFTLSFSGAVLYLAGGAERGALSQRYQDIAAKGVLWGFCLFSAAMFSGAVWAYLAWGTYWLWEPKTLWSFIVWFYYAGAMHAYYVRDWRGRGLSIATAGGFFVVLFTYLGVSLLMKSSHSF